MIIPGVEVSGGGDGGGDDANGVICRGKRIQLKV